VLAGSPTTVNTSLSLGETGEVVSVEVAATQMNYETIPSPARSSEIRFKTCHSTAEAFFNSGASSRVFRCLLARRRAGCPQRSDPDLHFGGDQGRLLL
jgi:hypothetical protein